MGRIGMRWWVSAAVVVASAAGAGPEPGALRPGLEAAVKAQGEAQRRFDQEYAGGATEEERRPVLERFTAATAANVDAVLQLVRERPGDPDVVPALKFVIVTGGRGPGDGSYRAIDILSDQHVRDPGMGDLCGRLFHFAHSSSAEALLRKVMASHPGRADRGLACYSLAYLLDLRAGMIRRVRAGERPVDHYVDDRFKASTERLIQETDLPALDREVEALRERVVAEFADVHDWFTPDRTLGAIAAGELFAARHLAVGKVAPEVHGKDAEGKPFSLGEYRGKVVVLTFSASWCGPCVGMYPDERSLVRSLAGKPFALVGVNADADLATLKRSVAAGEITWRCWWDGGMDGPITTRWGVTAIPAVFVLDKTGVIRHKDVRGDALRRAVEALLDEGDGDRRTN